MKGGCVVENIQNLANIVYGGTSTRDSRDPQNHATKIHTDDGMLNANNKFCRYCKKLGRLFSKAKIAGKENTTMRVITCRETCETPRYH